MKKANFTNFMLALLCCMVGMGTLQAQQLTCGNSFFDAGGASGNYSDTAPAPGAPTLTTVCPSTVGQTVMVSFSKFDVAEGDRLVAYAGTTVNPANVLGLDLDGDNFSDLGTLPATGNGAGFGSSVANAPGGGWVQVPSFCAPGAIGGGCITFAFTRNGDNVKGAGWEAAITCTGSSAVSVNCRTSSFVNNVFIAEDCGLSTVRFPVPSFLVCDAPIDANYSINCGEVTFAGTVTANGTGFVTGDFPVGKYTVTFQGVPPAGVSASQFVCTYSFQVYPNGLGCNDDVYLSLGSGCASTITPQLLLEGACDETYVDYEVVLPESFTTSAAAAAAEHRPLIIGETPEGYPIVDFSYVHCRTEYDVQIRRIIDVACNPIDLVDACWGTITIEDKIPPVFIDGPAPTAIPCYDDQDLLAKLNARRSNGSRVIDVTGGVIVGATTGLQYQIPGLTPNGAGGYVEIEENCSYEVTVSDWRKSPADCTIDNLGPYQCWNLAQLNLVNSIASVFYFFERDFIVTDKCGNKDTYTQLVLAVQPDIVAPAPQIHIECPPGVDAFELIQPQNLYQGWLDWVAEGRPNRFCYQRDYPGGYPGNCAYTAPTTTDWTTVIPVQQQADPRQFYASYLPNFDPTPGDYLFINYLATLGIVIPPDFLTEDFITDASGNEIPAALEHADCGYAIDWQDGNKIETCDGFKVFRKWTVFNWCDGHLELIDIIPQVIIVKAGPPVLTSDLTYRVGGAGYYDCSANLTFDKPSVVGKTGNIIVTLEVNGVRKSFTGNAPLSFDNVEVGTRVCVNIYASYGCPQEYLIGTKCFDIVDNIPPQAICETHHVVSLGPDCTAQVQAQALDDGSYDNCGVITFKVARMDDLVNVENLDDPRNDDIFTEYVEFTYEDLLTNGEVDCLNNSTTVVLKVKDGRGNRNYCMSQVTVQDKLPPVCENQAFQFSCPDDIVDELIAAKLASSAAARTAALTEIVNGLGSPLAYDNCSEPTITIVSSVFTNFDETCRSGFITYRYSAVDACGNRSGECTGRIDVTPLSDWSMVFPRDYEIQCTDDATTAIPPAAKLSDILTNDGCDFWGMEVTEHVFHGVEDACYKIVREYHLINWCTWDPSNTEDAIVERPADLILTPGAQVRLRYRDVVAPFYPNPFDNDLSDTNDGDPYDTDWTWDGNYGNEPFDGDFVLIDYLDFPHGSGSTVTPYAGFHVYDAISNITGVVEAYVSAQNYGNIVYRQIIKVNDFTAPIITADTLSFCGGNIEPLPGENCTADVDVPFTASDVCTPVGELNVTYKLRPFGGSAINDPFGTLVSLGGDNYAVRGKYPIGPDGVAEHILVVRVEDGCGNITTVQIPFTVKDCKAPTAYCIFGLSADLMVTGMVELWASDFDAGSFDFCTPQNELKLTFADPRIYPDSIGRIFDCNNGEIGTVPVELWVQDKAGNVSFCSTFVVIQPNQPGTDCPSAGAGAIVAGAVLTAEDEAVEGVELSLSGSMDNTQVTTADGQFVFSALQLAGDYTVTPRKNDAPLNGVSTFDLVLISKHVLGVQLLNSPYKMIAADVNNSKNISTFDMVTLRKLILEIDTQFPNNTSWRFIREDYNFPDPSNPWAADFSAQEVYSVNDLAGDLLNANFVAIKTGDINNDAEVNSLLGAQGRSTAGEMVLKAVDQRLTAGETYTVDFTAADLAQIEGYQFTFNFNRNVLDLVDLKEGVAKQENFGFTRVSEGVINVSWNGEAANDAVLFSLVFTAKASADLSDVLSVSSKYTKAEAYNKAGDLLDVALSFNEGTAKAAGFELYQNTPNPFKGETLIGFNLPKAATATLTIHDVTGKVLKVVKGDYAKGKTTIAINSKELPQAGVLYYTLDTDGHSATMKMVVIE